MKSRSGGVVATVARLKGFAGGLLVAESMKSKTFQDGIVFGFCLASSLCDSKGSFMILLF